MKHLSVLLGLGVAAASLLPATASAQEFVVRDQVSHGTANCQAALPMFDGNIRKRPLAIANEGESNAFVTCDSESISNMGLGFVAVGVGLHNRGEVDLEVTCTLVDGLLTMASYYPQTVPVAAGGTNLVQWAAGEQTPGVIGVPAISCNLPAGVDLALTRFSYPESVTPED